MACWTKDLIVQFIDLYRSKECLWKVKSKEYSNRYLKERAYQDLINFARSFDHEANKDSVVKKINNLRSALRKEIKKVKISRREGELYEPKLWYYESLLFIHEQEMPASYTYRETNYPDEQSFEAPSSPIDRKPPIQCNDEPIVLLTPGEWKSTAAPENVTEPTPVQQHFPVLGQQINSIQKPTKRKADDEIHLTSQERLSSPASEDELDIFGKVVTHQLRKVTDNQLIIAQKLINDVLYQARLGTLTVSFEVKGSTNANIQPSMLGADGQDNETN